MMILLLITTIFLNNSIKSLVHINDHYSIRKNLICLKKYNLAEKKLILNVNWANRLIRTIKIADSSVKIISIIVPGAGLLKLGINSALTYLKNYQRLNAVTYLKKKMELRLFGCKVISSLTFIPYKWSNFDFLRDSMDGVIVQDKKWTQTIVARKIILRTRVTLKNAYQKKALFQSKMIRIGTRDLQRF